MPICVNKIDRLRIILQFDKKKVFTSRRLKHFIFLHTTTHLQINLFKKIKN